MVVVIGTVNTLKARIVKGATIIVVYTMFSTFYAYKLLKLTPWIGADTYPAYPCTLKNIIEVILSPWSFYLSRTVVDGGLPYLDIVKCIMYHLFGLYSEFVFVIFWLTIAGLGFFMLVKVLTNNIHVRVFGGLLYIVSTFTWHEAVHSIYGMLGAYAITPWIYHITFTSYRSLKLPIRGGSKRDLILGTVVLYLTGYVLGILATSTLFPYYSIYILFLWFPLTLTLFITHVTIKKLELASNLASIFLLLLGFLTPYTISYLSMKLTSLEYVGIKSAQELLNVKLADFSYNYRFNNAPLWLWLSYLWSKAWLFYYNEVTVLPIVVQGVILSYTAYCLRKIKRYRLPHAIMYLNSVIALILLVGFLIFATYISAVKNIELLKKIWNLPPLGILLAGITQPIKLGIPISFYEALIVTLFIIDVTTNIKHGWGGRPLLSCLAGVVICIIVLTWFLSAIMYAQNPPITENHYVVNEYMESLRLREEAINSLNLGSPYMFQPYVIVAPGKHYFKYYYTYAVALRPYKPFGAYIYGESMYKDVIELFEKITANRTNNVVANIIAKIFYVSTYISKSRNIFVFNYTKSPIYIVIPVGVISLGENSGKDYIFALMALASIIAKDKDLASKYLYSNVVFDVIPADKKVPAMIYVVIMGKRAENIQLALTKNVSNLILLINISDTDDVICLDNCISKLRDIVSLYSKLNIAWTTNLLPLRIKVHITDSVNETNKRVIGDIILRLNERYSPYWHLADINVEHTYDIAGYNVFIIINSSGINGDYLIQHRLWSLKVIFILVKILPITSLLIFLLLSKGTKESKNPY